MTEEEPHEIEQQRRLQQIGRNEEAEKQREEQEQAQDQQRREISEIYEDMRKRIPSCVVEQVTKEVTESIPPPARDQALISTEVESRIASVIAPYAHTIQKERKKRNTGFKQSAMATAHTDIREQAEAGLDTLIKARPLIEALREVRDYNNQDIILTVEITDSFLRSYNRFCSLIQEARGAYSCTLLPTLDIVDTYQRQQWFRQLQSQQILSDEQLNQCESQLRRLLK